ncbi:MAG: hypothetical protein WC136_03160 [Sphaerochaeta sp.]|nr:hypothetical protein [Sphaerochaeta sp.]
MQTLQEHQGKLLMKTALFASLVMLLFIPLQIIIFAISRPPETAVDWFALFEQNWLLGLLEMDALYIIDNVLVALVYLALYHELRWKRQDLMTIALVLGLLGIGAYFSSNPAFEMWEASRRYTQSQDKNLWLSIGEGLILRWRGTAFDIYYVLNGITLIIISICMYNSRFGNTTATIGLISGLLMAIPSTAGVIGLVFSILSLIPWMLFLFCLVRTFSKPTA